MIIIRLWFLFLLFSETYCSGTQLLEERWLERLHYILFARCVRVCSRIYHSSPAFSYRHFLNAAMNTLQITAVSRT